MVCVLPMSWKIVLTVITSVFMQIHVDQFDLNAVLFKHR